MPDWWPEILAFSERFGVPAAILLFVMWGLSKLLKWIGAELIVPVRNKGFEFMKRMERGIDALESNTEKQAASTEKIAEVMDRHNEEDRNRHREVMTEVGIIKLRSKER